MYHLPHVCCTLVPEIHVYPEILRVFWYIDALTCVIYNCAYSKDDWSTNVVQNYLLCHENYRLRQRVSEYADT